MDNPENDLKTLWQDQPTEPTAMSLEKIQQRAHQLQVRIHREKLIVYGISAVAIPLYLFAVIISPDRLATAGYLLTLLGILFVLYVNHRHVQPNRQAVARASTACADFHRRALAQRRDLLRNVWLWAVAPVMPGAILMFIHMHRLMASLPPYTSVMFGLHPSGFAAVMDTIGLLALFKIVISSHWRAYRLNRELKALDGI